MSPQKQYEVKTEKLIKRSVGDVFKALSQGLLFMNCGVDSQSMELDFKVGGKYRINFKNYEIKGLGEFLEIIPDKKIVFTWCSSWDEPLTPDTKVTIDLLAEGGKTKLLLTHTGFKDKETCDNHEEGWNSGLGDFSEQLQEGTLRMVRVYSAPVAKLFKECQERLVKGKVLESVANQKIIFDLDSSRVTLSFDEEDEGGSSFTLIHNGLKTDTLQKSYRKDWEQVSESMRQTLS